MTNTPRDIEKGFDELNLRQSIGMTNTPRDIKKGFDELNLR